ncbi:hypothetical protein TNCV_3196491 [Trichonephila clavipes]|nr:hypothetical protein TNCV_3196491 [Trichonephila clavipes]
MRGLCVVIRSDLRSSVRFQIIDHLFPGDKGFITPPPTMEPKKGRQARRSSDMRQARHLPQRWYWDIVVYRTRIGNRRTNHQPIDRSGLKLQPPVNGEAWAKGHATGTPDSTFPGTGRVRHVGFYGASQTQNWLNIAPETFVKIHLF